MLDGYFNVRSECLVSFTGKKIRQYPVFHGSTSLGICIENEMVRRTTTEFMKNLGYKGILDIGYRYDARDGQYKLLDVNPRIGSTFRFFVAENGMDVARAMYLDLTGQPVAAGDTVEGRKWLVEDFDIFSALRSWREGRLSLRGWVRSLGGVQEAACFALDDPAPFFMTAVADCCELYRWWNCGRAAVRGEAQETAPPVPSAL